MNGIHKILWIVVEIFDLNKQLKRISYFTFKNIEVKFTRIEELILINLIRNTEWNLNSIFIQTLRISHKNIWLIPLKKNEFLPTKMISKIDSNPFIQTHSIVFSFLYHISLKFYEANSFFHSSCSKAHTLGSFRCWGTSEIWIFGTLFLLVA